MKVVIVYAVSNPYLCFQSVTRGDVNEKDGQKVTPR